jgi:hypothetical protein
MTAASWSYGFNVTVSTIIIPNLGSRLSDGQTRKENRLVVVGCSSSATGKLAVRR